MAHPHKTASGVVSESPLILTDITADDGTVGHSLIFTYTPAALQPTAELIRNLESLLINEELAPVHVGQKLSKRLRLLGTQGLVGMALSAVDMALWDTLARSRGISLVRFLGGVERSIPAYGAIGFDGASASAASALDWLKRGFSAVKVKIGYASWRDDLEVIRAIKRAAAGQLDVMVDYNQSLTPGEAIERLRPMEDEDLTWVEEPTLAHDYLGHAAIAREIRTPVQCGENWWGPMDAQHAIEAHASDYIMPDVMKIGGVTGWMTVAAMAQARSIRMSSHLWPEISAQLMCVTPTAHWLEYSDWWNPVLANPIRIQDGRAVPDGRPGSGLEWDETAVGRYLV